MSKKRNCPFYLFVFLLMLSPAFCLRAQDTIVKSIELQLFSITDFSQNVRAYTINPGLNIEKPDSIQQSRYQAGTLTDLLGENGLLFLKSYGGGNLATTALRGASASQTSVLWNGVNLQSPTNGTSDLSLMPAILCDRIAIQNGGGSAGWGSGAIGGVIQTNSDLKFNEGFHVRYAGQGGSFGELNNGMLIGFGNTKISGDVRVYRQQAKNEFVFRNTALMNSPNDTLKNSDFLQQGIFGEIGIPRKDEHHLLTIKCWYQSSDRGIPATMLEVGSSARQKDEFFRAVANYRYYSSSDFLLEVKSAVLTEFMDYFPGSNWPSSFTHSFSFINEADCRFKIFKKIPVTFGINNTWSKADVTDYVPVTTQNRSSVFAAFQYIFSPNWNLVLNLRDEQVQGKITPLVGSLGIEWSRMKFITLKSNFSRNYRLPTFNDLYWVPGGNPDLKPEDSWNEDLSAIYHYEKKNVLINYSVTVFNRNTTNWILWQPGPGYWSPENILSVWSRGFEHRLKAEWTKNKMALTFLGGYDYVKATSEKSTIPGDVSLGKQLMYVPANRFFGMLQITYCKFYLSYNHSFTGLRFTATDQTSYLNAFDLADLTIGKRMDMKNSYGDIFFRVNNLFNSEYQAVSWRPMPGRNFQIGITIDFKKPLKEKNN